MAKRKKLSKRAKWAIAGVVLIGGFFVVREVLVGEPKKPPVKKYDPDQAVSEAINELGKDAGVLALTELAYPLAYPDCPPRLDPDDPTHAKCIDHWLDLRERISKRVPAGKGTGGTRGIAKKLGKWIDGLSSGQRTQLRNTIGAKLYDPIANGAKSNNDSQVTAGLLRLKRSINDLIAESKLQALALQSKLQNILGPKLDEFMKIVGI